MAERGAGSAICLDFLKVFKRCLARWLEELDNLRLKEETMSWMQIAMRQRGQKKILILYMP